MPAPCSVTKRAQVGGRVGLDRPAGALRGGLGRGASGAARPVPAAPQRKARGRGGRRSRRPDRGRRPRAPRPRRHGLRGAAPAGGRARLRHPGVPAAEADRRPARSRRSRAWESSSATTSWSGKTRSVASLLADGYDAVFVGTGAGLPRFLGIPGENLCGVYSANEYLTRANLMGACEFPRLRHAARAEPPGGGAGRRQRGHGRREDGPALRGRERRHRVPALREGDAGAARGGAPRPRGGCRLRAAAGAHPHPGRRGAAGSAAWRCGGWRWASPTRAAGAGPCPSPGSERVLEVDTVIVAIGNAPNPLVPRTTPGLRTTRWGNVVVDPATQRTSLRGVFAGGRHRPGRGHRDPGHGRGPPGGEGDRPFLEDGDWAGAPRPPDDVAIPIGLHPTAASFQDSVMEV